jgi:hypothetical protein
MDKDRIIALWEQHLGAELFAKVLLRDPHTQEQRPRSGVRLEGGLVNHDRLRLVRGAAVPEVSAASCAADTK